MNEENGKISQVFPNVTDPVYSFSYPDGKLHAKDCTMNEISPYIGVDFNWTPAAWFNLGIGISIGAYEPSITHVYNGLYIDQDTTNGVTSGDISESLGGFIIEQEMEGVFTGRIEMKPQFFLSPRFTIGLYLAFMYTSPFKLSRSTINNDYVTSYQFTSNAQMEEKYLGINPSLLGVSHDITDLSLVTMLYGISFNFYF